MNLPKGWTQEADHYSQTTDEAQTVLRLNIEPDGGWSIRGYGYAPSETTIERLLWSLEPTPDREGLAKALRAARGCDLPWDRIGTDDQAGWLSVADTAICLCGGVREEAPEGWPEEWRDDGYGDRVRQGVVVNHWRLPNTEPGRTAAWKLEGKDAPATPKERIFACPSCGPQDRCDEDGCCITHGLDLIEVADEGSAYAVKEACDQLIADHDTDRARHAEELRAAIESRDLADREVEALRACLKRANEEIAELKTRHRVLSDRLKFVEANNTALHHDRDTQRAIVDHMRDMIVDIARGRT